MCLVACLFVVVLLFVLGLVYASLCTSSSERMPCWFSSIELYDGDERPYAVFCVLVWYLSFDVLCSWDEYLHGLLTSLYFSGCMDPQS